MKKTILKTTKTKFNNNGSGDCAILAPVVRILDCLRDDEGEYGKLLDDEF